MPEMRAARANERISNTTGDVWPCRTSGRQFRRSGLIDQDRDLVRNAARSLKPMPFKLIEDPLYKRTGVRRCRIRFHRSRWRHSGRWQAQCHRLHHRQYLVVNQGQQGQHADAAKVQPSRSVLLDIRINSLCEVGRTPGPQPTPGRLGRIVLLDIRVNSLGEVGRTPGPQPTPGRLGRIVTRIHNQRLLEHTAVDTTLAKPVPALRRLSSSKIRPPNLLQQNRWDKFRAEDSWAALDWQA